MTSQLQKCHLDMASSGKHFTAFQSVHAQRWYGALTFLLSLSLSGGSKRPTTDRAYCQLQSRDFGVFHQLERHFYQLGSVISQLYRFYANVCYHKKKPAVKCFTVYPKYLKQGFFLISEINNVLTYSRKSTSSTTNGRWSKGLFLNLKREKCIEKILYLFFLSQKIEQSLGSTVCSN